MNVRDFDPRVAAQYAPKGPVASGLKDGNLERVRAEWGSAVRFGLIVGVGFFGAGVVVLFLFGMFTLGGAS